jgi:hypothetical protein
MEMGEIIIIRRNEMKKRRLDLKRGRERDKGRAGKEEGQRGTDEEFFFRRGHTKIENGKSERKGKGFYTRPTRGSPSPFFFFFFFFSL